MNILCKRFRKAVDANAMVIAAAIGVLVIIGLYYLSRNTMSGVASSQTNMGTAMSQGIEELKK